MNIEKLIAEGKLAEAHQFYGEFLRLCEKEKLWLIQNESSFSNLRDRQLAGLVGYENQIERNRIAFSLLSQLDDFKQNVLSKYFDISNREEYFSNISSRDAVITEILDLRLKPKRYVLERPFLKEGNSSIIFRLQNADTNRHAIAMVFKVPELAQQNQDEIKRLTDLRHRNIIKLLDHEITRFPYFVITEYVYGENLPTALESVGPRPMAQAADWLYQLADALDYLRNKRVWHTNVRPSKIYIDDEWQVMISPFDLLKVGTGENTLTRYRDVCQYGSPELLYQGDSRLNLEQTVVSDQYSLGLIGYKMLTGKDLFEGEWPHNILESRRLFVSDAKYRRAKFAQLPPGKLTEIIHRLLQESASGRFADLHQVLRALHPLTRKEYPEASPARCSYRRCLSANKSFIHDFYQNFHQKAAHTVDHFPRTKRQSVMLQMAVDLLLDIDEKRDWFVKLLKQPTHSSYTAADFEIFLDTFIETVRQNDIRSWDETLAGEWQLLRDKAMALVQAEKGQ